MSLLILRGLLLAAEALAISALLPLLAWMTGVVIRRNAAMRHLVWLAVFGVLLALPLLALIAPPRMLMLPAAAPVPVDVAMAAPVVAAYAQSWSVESLIALAAAPLCGLWLLGVGWNLLRLALGAHGLMRLRRASVAFDRIANCDVRLGGGPLTFGFCKPIIILPNDAPQWTPARRDAVLRHELAHVARHDSVTQWLAALACAFYWPNPLVWLGAKTLRRDAEMAADDAVLAAGVQPSVYAAELVRLARESRGHRFAVAMATPSSLEARVTSVLSPTPSRKGVTPMDVLKLGLLGSACAVALAFVRPDIALAQASPPVQAAPVEAAPVTVTAPIVKAAHIRKPRMDRIGAVDVDVDADGASADGTISGEKDGVKVETHFHHHAGLSDADREQIKQAMVQVKVELAGIRPQVEKAVAEARATQASAQAWHQAAAEIHQAVEHAMEEVRPYIREAARDPQAGEKIGRKVSEAMARVQPQIDAAIARANARHAEDAVPPIPPEPAPPPPAQ